MNHRCINQLYGCDSVAPNTFFQCVGRSNFYLSNFQRIKSGIVHDRTQSQVTQLTLLETVWIANISTVKGLHKSYRLSFLSRPFNLLTLECPRCVKPDPETVFINIIFLPCRNLPKCFQVFLEIIIATFR